MTTDCLTCHENTIENNTCLKCKSSSFTFPIEAKERQQSSEYKKFISKISKQLDISEQTLHNLTNFKFLTIIPNTQVEEFYNQVTISIPEQIFSETYKKSIPFIFSHLDQFSQNYSAQEVYMNNYDKIFLFKNKNNNELIECAFNTYDIKYDIILYIPYYESKTIIADPNILSEDELAVLEDNLATQSDSDTSIIKLTNINGSLYFTFIAEINNNFSYDIHDSCMNIYDLINTFNYQVDVVIEQYKETNSKIFERALLEQQIQAF